MRHTYTKPHTKQGMENVMRVVYNKRPVPGAFEDFDTVRARVEREWKQVVRIVPVDVI